MNEIGKTEQYARSGRIGKFYKMGLYKITSQETYKEKSFMVIEKAQKQVWTIKIKNEFNLCHHICSNNPNIVCDDDSMAQKMQASIQAETPTFILWGTVGEEKQDIASIGIILMFKTEKLRARSKAEAETSLGNEYKMQPFDKN